jgi:sarcosine oxidase, subunit gamma
VLLFVTQYSLTRKTSEETLKRYTMIIKESPLQGMSIETAATVAIRELPGLHTIDLRVAPLTLSQAAITEALEISLHTKPGQIQAASTCDTDHSYSMCLAPDWWLIVGIPEVEQKLSSLRSNEDYHFSAVDVSGQRTTIELEGPKVRELLAQLWEQDLREKTFPVGSVSQGLMAKAPVIICHTGPSQYRVMVRSSFAMHLWKALVDAVEEWV